MASAERPRNAYVRGEILPSGGITCLAATMQPKMMTMTMVLIKVAAVESICCTPTFANMAVKAAKAADMTAQGSHVLRSGMGLWILARPEAWGLKDFRHPAIILRQSPHRIVSLQERGVLSDLLTKRVPILGTRVQGASSAERCRALPLFSCLEYTARPGIWSGMVLSGKNDI